MVVVEAERRLVGKAEPDRMAVDRCLARRLVAEELVEWHSRIDPVVVHYRMTDTEAFRSKRVEVDKTWTLL